MLLDVGEKCSSLFGAALDLCFLGFCIELLKSLQHLLMIGDNLGENKLVLDAKGNIYCTLSKGHEPFKILLFGQP